MLARRLDGRRVFLQRVVQLPVETVAAVLAEYVLKCRLQNVNTGNIMIITFGGLHGTVTLALKLQVEAEIQQKQDDIDGPVGMQVWRVAC